MTPQLIEAANEGIEAEVDRLTYSAYLLTLDPSLAMSIVMTVIERTEEDGCSTPSLLRRTVEISLRQLACESTPHLDCESSAFEAVLYGDVTNAGPKGASWFRENSSGNTIVLLDRAARIAFVLHHILDYQVTEAAAMLEMSEKEYRADLQNAYLQLASVHVPLVALGNVVADARA